MSAGYQPWGSGVYGGAQGCVADNSSGGRRIPKEIQDMDDEIDEVKKKQKDAEKEARELKKEIDALKKVTDKGVLAIKTVFKPNLQTGILQHVGYGAAQPLDGSNTNLAKACNGNSLVDSPEITNGVPGDWASTYCARGVDGSGTLAADETAAATAPASDNWQASWASKVAESQNVIGRIDKQVCEDTAYIKGDYRADLIKGSRSKQDSVENCKNAVYEISGKLSELEDLELKRKNALDDAKAFKDEAAALKKSRNARNREIKKEIRDGDYEEDEDDDRTQADYCPTGNCRGGQRVSSTDRIISLVGSLGIAAGSYFGLKSYGNSQRKAAQYASDKNAELGWPTSVPQGWGLSPYSAFGLALPMAMNGIYGATFGGGIGGNGCGGFGGVGGMGGWPGGGQYGGGAFGYPQGWGPNGGGGIMNGGCGPWGCTGYPGGYPGGGYGVPYANGGYQGYMGYPGMNMQGGQFQGAIGIGIAGVYQGGYQGGFPGGYGGQFAPTFNSYPYPAGGGFQGYPASPYPMAGGPITGVYSTNTNIPYVPMGGQFQGGMTPFSPTYSAYPMPAGGGFPGGYQGGYQGGLGFPGGYGGMPAQGGYMGTYGGYNQVLMQQAAMAQAQVQDYSARLQLTGRLSSQITQIQYQIQSILSGAGSASGYGYGGYGGVGYPTGNILPYPGTSTFTDPNLNTTTTGTGVQTGRGRFN